jgi:hypothetical protein
MSDPPGPKFRRAQATGRVLCKIDKFTLIQRLTEFYLNFNGPAAKLLPTHIVSHCSAAATDIAGGPCEYDGDDFIRVGAWC